MLLSAFIALFVSTAYAQAPTDAEYLILHAAPAIMIKVAECESGTQQFKADGSLVRDGVTGTHVGLFQIAESWIPTAKKHGDDIYTPEGNISFALYLYAKNGLRDWKASKDCWSKK